MNPARPSLVRALLAATTVMLLIGVVGAVTVDEDDTDRVAASDRTTTTQAVVESPVDTDTTLAGPTSTLAGGTSTTRAATSVTTTPGTAAVPNPGPTKAPAAGTYAYTMISKGDQAPNGTSETRFDVLPPEGGATRRRETYKDAQGTTVAHEETWATDAVRITRSQQSGTECNWQPPILVLQLPLAIGKTWKSESTCTATAQGIQFTIRQVTTSKVTGKVLEKVGDTSVPTWVIEATGTSFVKTPFGSTETSVSIVRHFASDRGLVIVEKASGKTPAGDYEYERRLRSLKPA